MEQVYQLRFDFKAKCDNLEVLNNLLRSKY